MTTLSVRLSDDLVESLDELVDERRFDTRTAAVRVALEKLLREEHRRRLDAAIVEGYRRDAPPEVQADTLALAERSIEEEPW